jgi:hypothetical protein
METIKHGEWSRNGKGDDPRPVNAEKYRANFDAINWRKKAKTDKNK